MLTPKNWGEDSHVHCSHVLFSKSVTRQPPSTEQCASILAVNLDTLRKTNISPENRPGPKKESHLPTIYFQVRTVNFTECIFINPCYIYSIFVRRMQHILPICHLMSCGFIQGGSVPPQLRTLVPPKTAMFELSKLSSKLVVLTVFGGLKMAQCFESF